MMSGSTFILNQIGGRFASLRRLASLLELAGLTVRLPNLANLIPVDLINLAKYQELLAACPGLLPPATNASLTDLKNTVQDSYQGLLDQALNHPFDRMSRLQGVLNAEISSVADKFNKQIGPALNGLACIQNLCGAAAAGGTTLFDPTAVERAKQAFVDGIQLDPSVLTATQKANAATVIAIEDELTRLMSPSLTAV